MANKKAALVKICITNKNERYQTVNESRKPNASAQRCHLEDSVFPPELLVCTVNVHPAAQLCARWSIKQVMPFVRSLSPRPPTHSSLVCPVFCTLKVRRLGFTKPSDPPTCKKVARPISWLFCCRPTVT